MLYFCHTLKAKKRIDIQMKIKKNCLSCMQSSLVDIFERLVLSVKQDFIKEPCQASKTLNVVNLVIFAIEVTSAKKKKMMGLLLNVYDEEEKEVTLEFVTILCFQVLMDKVQEILLNYNTDISNPRFSCFDGTNTLSGEDS